MRKAIDIRIYGHVFNVGFRRYVHRYALECDVVGYVENDHALDCVHIFAEGEELKLDQFVLYCGEGTPYSTITNMKIDPAPVTGKYTRFEQIR